jgi:hypothetical protein
MSSMFVFTQAAPHMVASQLQTPAVHSPKEHRVPHAPQCLGLDIGSTQRPSHSRNVAGQTQTLESQTRPPVQPTPHPPQFSASRVVSTHALAQSVKSTLHIAEQTPSEHTSPIGHAVPQPPQ